MIERNWTKLPTLAATAIFACVAFARPPQSPTDPAPLEARSAATDAPSTQPANHPRDPDSSSTSDSMPASELQALPLPRRDWQSFLFDTSGQDASAEEGRVATSRTAVAVDGVSMRLAFGDTVAEHGRTRDSLAGPASGEAATRTIQRESEGNTESPARFAANMNVVTERGTNRIHGQGFIFDRQNVWGAQNPYTRWVKEAAPATIITVPTFAALPYSPSDREWVSGFGIGGTLRRDRLFWFASIDAFQRNDPGVSTVKHPDNFFARPSNDQMQVLSARLGLSSANPVVAGLGAYSKMLETLDGLLGPAARRSSRWSGFARLDWKAGERNTFTLESSGATLDSPGGGLTRASEANGTHSFGSSSGSQSWLLGRWESFVTPNLLAVTQGAVGRQIQRAPGESPSPYEQTLNVSAWGRLPQIIVDSRYGFSIGNPARFGGGSYPDEHLYRAQEQLDWVRGNLLLRAGFSLDHNKDATSRLRNQTGTYYYSSVENFASDALAFAAFGLGGQLDPMDQHNCDQTGRAWRDAAGVLHGLGYLPCYSYYSQTMGPSDWWLSTNDFSGYMTSQWQPAKLIALSLAMRWEQEQLPPPLAALANLDLPLTHQLPGLGNEWEPRAGLALGSGGRHWPVLRLGYAMYFGRTPNATIETARTHTGSLKGDLDFFMRPTDNLNAGGAPPFPYVLAGEPSTVVKPAAVEFAPRFRNGDIHQAEAAIEEELPWHLHLEASAAASLGRRLPVVLDANIDPAINPKTITYAVIDANRTGPLKSSQITVPFYASWPSLYTSTGFAGRLNSDYQQVAEIFSRANSTYEAAMLRLVRSGRNLSLRVRYTYSHATDWNPNETAQVTGSSVFDPADFRQEYGTSTLDIRHSVSTAVILEPRWKLNREIGRVLNGWRFSGVGQFHSGLPYSMRTEGSLAKEFTSGGTPIVALGTGLNGYGGDNRVYGVGRNTYRYPNTWKADVLLGKEFRIGHERQLELMAESFNLFNHQNVSELETVGYSIELGGVNGTLPTLNYLAGLKPGQTEFGTPLNINATDFYRERQIQFGARVRF
jgi:hypothetical protein